MTSPLRFTIATTLLLTAFTQPVTGQEPPRFPIERLRRDLDRGMSPDTMLSAETGKTLLHLAAGWGDDDAVSLLIARGARLNTRSQDGQTLVMAALASRRLSTLQLVLGRYADPNGVDTMGFSALWYAVQLAHMDSTLLGQVHQLLQWGANPSERGLQQASPLAHVVGLGDSTLVHLLLAAGADPGDTTRVGTPLTRSNVTSEYLFAAARARQEGRPPPPLPSPTALPRDPERLAIDRALKAAAPSGTLLRAVNAGDSVAVRAALLAGANPRVRGVDGVPPVVVAAGRTDVAIVRLLAAPPAAFHGAAAARPTDLELARARDAAYRWLSRPVAQRIAVAAALLPPVGPPLGDIDWNAFEMLVDRRDTAMVRFLLSVPIPPHWLQYSVPAGLQRAAQWADTAFIRVWIEADTAGRWKRRAGLLAWTAMREARDEHYPQLDVAARFLAGATLTDTTAANITHLAITLRRWDLLRLALDHGASVADARQYALRWGKLDALPVLAERNVKVDSLSVDDVIAAAHAGPELIRSLQSSGIDAVKSRLLHYAAVFANAQAVSVIVQDPKVRSYLTASDSSGYYEILAALNEANGAIADTAPWYRRGVTETVRALLEAGAHVNPPGSVPSPALIQAVAFDNADVVRMLLAAGARVKDNSKEASFLCRALGPTFEQRRVTYAPPPMAGGTPYVNDLRMPLASLRLVLAAGANPDPHDCPLQSNTLRRVQHYKPPSRTPKPHWGTPLMKAVFDLSRFPSTADLVRLLLDAGANPKARSTEGLSPLDLANEWGGAVGQLVIEAARRH